MTRAITFSPSITVPLTHDCPWNCTYCGYRSDTEGLIAQEEFTRLLDVAIQNHATEVLFLSGEMPDSMPHIRRALDHRGFADFIAFTRWACEQALTRGLLPHTNIGALSRSQLLRLADVNASMGLMLENIDDAFNRSVAPEKSAAGRLRTIETAGELRIPYTSGILIGLGESHESRLRSLDALAILHSRYGHLQEIILQNYIPNAGSRLVPTAPAPSLEEYQALIAHWRSIAPDVAIQIPPNINPHWERLLPLIDDLGGVSIEGDLVNPLSPWAPPAAYAAAAARQGRSLNHRWPAYDRFLQRDWIRPPVWEVLRRRSPALGFDGGFPSVGSNASQSLRRAAEGFGLSLESAIQLAEADGAAEEELCAAADELNRKLNGTTVSYVVNRNANFTNVCTTNCTFCGFYRPPGHAEAYTRPIHAVVERVLQTPWVTEVCLQGGIHPELRFEDYRDLLRALKDALPGVHLHAYSPMEIHSLHLKTGWPYHRVLSELRDAGLGSIPGTAAEILHNTVRDRLSPDKLRTEHWIEIVETAHNVGLPSTSTILFGHGESWADIFHHLSILRNLQARTGRFTEFVPLAFVPHRNRLGSELSRASGASTEQIAAQSTARARRLYPLTRLFLGPAFRNLQTSWVKLGTHEAARMLQCGCNDFGGTLYEESITRGSGGTHGEHRTPAELQEAIRSVGRTPRQRTTLYRPISSVAVPAGMSV
jgi:FO synthase